MTITVSEYEYGNPLTPPKSRKQKAPVSNAAVIAGLLILAAAAAEAYWGWRLMRYVRRLESLRIFDMFMAGQGENPAWIAFSEATQYIWLGITWLGSLLLGLAGLWIAVRRRFGWRMLWTGAIATILAGVLTVVGGYVLEHYAGFPPQAKRIYAIAFLIHSAPGWVILGMWLYLAPVRGKPTPPQGPADASAASPETAA